MRNLGIILWKEARELLTRQMLVPLIIMAVLFAFIGRAIRSERRRSQGPQKVIVSDQDQSALSRELTDALAEEQLTVVMADSSRERLLQLARDTGAGWVIIIPAGISDSIRELKAADIDIINIVRGFSISQTMKSAGVRGALGLANARIAKEYLSRAYPDARPEDLQEPLRPTEFVMVRDRVAPGNQEMLAGIIFSQTFMIPIILLMVIIYSSQMIAASIGQEKENKTLETLLTVPISRISIVTGKMLGAAIIALIISAIFMTGMAYYTGSMTEGMPTLSTTGLAGLGLEFNLGSYLLIGASLFLAVLAALALATLLAIFAGDARSAQVSVTPLMVLVLIPYFFSMVFDVNTIALPLRIIIYAIPFSYPFLTPKAVLFGNYGVVFAGLAYLTLFAAACIVAAARVFNSERVFTTKLKLRRPAR